MSSDDILFAAARDGSIDITEWPRVLETVLQKLHHIVHNDFPIPSIPLPSPLPPSIDPEVVASTPPPPASDTEPATQTQLSSTSNDDEPPPANQSSVKENEVPGSTSSPSHMTSALKTDGDTSQHVLLNSIPTQPGALPPDLLSSYTASTRILEASFAQSPPYTIQRLAELVTEPKKHYRFLPAYLRALDRVVSVSSPVSDFPLPALHPSSNGGFLTNGETGQVQGLDETDTLGSDESLGGALLTPIPWLRNLVQTSGNGQEGELHSESTETIDGPNGAGSIETVSVTVNGIPSASSAAHTSPTPASPTLSEQSDASTGSNSSAEASLRELGAVTQGELLRQEQEAGVVPVAQAQSRRHILPPSSGTDIGREAASAAASASTAPDTDVITESEEMPHARGPEEIGMEDMGPQRRTTTTNSGGSAALLDMEAAVGRQSNVLATSPPDHAQLAEAANRAEKDDEAGEPGRDPADKEKEAEQLQEAMYTEQKHEADADGDVMIADADGKEVDGHAQEK